MAELRPPMLDDYGLLSALRWAGEQFGKRTGAHLVRVEWVPTPINACRPWWRPLSSVSLK